MYAVHEFAGLGKGLGERLRRKGPAVFGWPAMNGISACRWRSRQASSVGIILYGLLETVFFSGSNSLRNAPIKDEMYCFI